MSHFNLEKYEKIESECAKYGADVLVVTKSQDIETIMELYDYGLRDFGENRLQDALPKIKKLPKDIRWHFLGQLQRNKVQKVLDLFSCIHSVDRIALIEELEKRNCLLPLFLQVNVTGEKTKGGFNPEAFMTAVAAASSLQVIGVMTMAEQEVSMSAVREAFRKTKALAIAASLPGCSMGMSDDYQIALEEGASVVRIGRALFQ